MARRSQSESESATCLDKQPPYLSGSYNKALLLIPQAAQSVGSRGEQAAPPGSSHVLAPFLPDAWELSRPWNSALDLRHVAGQQGLREPEYLTTWEIFYCQTLKRHTALLPTGHLPKSNQTARGTKKRSQAAVRGGSMFVENLRSSFAVSISLEMSCVQVIGQRGLTCPA